MRRNRDKRNGKKVFFLCSIIFVTVFMGLGFSYFSDVISLEANANLYASKDYLWYKLINDFSPSSLVPTQYENGKYAYVGSNPDNYIQIGGSSYRIISIEPDHTIRITSDTAENNSFDDVGNRTSSSTYCTDLEHGCNAYGQTSVLTNGEITGSVESNCSIYNFYGQRFAQGYYSTLFSYIEEHSFNVGAVTTNSTLAQVISQEQAKTWFGYGGLITVSDVLFAESGSVNASMSGTYDSYLFSNSSQKFIWTMNALSNDSSKVWVVTPNKTLDSKYAYLTSEEIDNNVYSYAVLPVFHLKSSVKYSSGTGTQVDPYILQ